MNLKSLCFALLLGFFCLSIPSSAIPKYDGRITVNGIQLLQDSEDSLGYYYVPPYPRLSINAEDHLEFLCMKYVGKTPEQNGGIFHCLVEFALSVDEVNELEKALRSKVSGSHIIGQVPLSDSVSGEDGALGGFRITSATLSDADTNPKVSVVTSGRAPILPGSKAAVAAKLDQTAATLLWASLESPTSDISVTVDATYEALAPAFNATITAEMSTLYEHFSDMTNIQGGSTRNQVLDVVDSLVSNGVFKLEVVDRSAGLGIKNKDMEGLLNMVTDKVINLMFDANTGWSKTPDTVVAIEDGQIKGRKNEEQNTGEQMGSVVSGVGKALTSVATMGGSDLMASIFGSEEEDLSAYVPDNQHVLKNVKSISSHKFYMNLSKQVSVKVPISSTGNIGGVYSALGDNEDYFRIVNLDDASFQDRNVHVQIDADFVETFDELINFVTINFRKKYDTGHDDVTKELTFNYQTVKEGMTFQSISYPRLGQEGSEWTDYEYQVAWSMRGKQDLVTVPADKSEWISTNSSALALRPVFDKKEIEVEVDAELMRERGISTVSVDIASKLDGELQVIKTVRISSKDVETTKSAVIYFDKGEQIVYRTIWYSNQGETKDKHKPVEADYIFLIPPVLPE